MKISFLFGTSLFLFLLVLGAITPLFLSVLEIDKSSWAYILEFILPEALGNSLKLLLGVVIGTSFLGVSLAWVCDSIDFWGRKWAEILLMLPLTIPGYVFAFVFLGGLDSTGLIFRFLKIDVATYFSSLFGLIFVMSLSLFPYVFLLSRLAFRNFSNSYKEVVETLGFNSQKKFFKLQLPMAMPWVLSGLLLVSMETLSDFGTVSVFNIDTLTTAIYKSWFGFFSWKAAAQMSLFLLVFTFLFFRLESLISKKKYYSESENKETQKNKKFWPRLLAAFWVYGVVTLSLFFPFLQLLDWASKVEEPLQLWGYIFNSVFFGLVGGFILLILSVLIAFSSKKVPLRLNLFLIQFSSMGYAIPGTVLAVGVLSFLYSMGLQVGFLLVALLALMLAYVIRFFLVAYRSSVNALGQIHPNLSEVASTLGSRPKEKFQKIYLPLIGRGLVLSFVLSFVEIVKEMPMTLMLRPFGWDTLAVKIFEYTSEGEWERAALPALLIIVVSLIPLLLVGRRFILGDVNR